MAYEMATDFIASLILYTDCCTMDKDNIRDFLEGLVDAVIEKIE